MWFGPIMQMWHAVARPQLWAPWMLLWHMIDAQRHHTLLLFDHRAYRHVCVRLDYLLFHSS